MIDFLTIITFAALSAAFAIYKFKNSLLATQNLKFRILSSGRRINRENKDMQIRKEAGFSLGELITIMGILMVLAAIAIPSYLDWRSKAQLSRAARDVYSGLQKVKVEAVRRNQICGITFRDAENDYVVYVENGVPPYQYDNGVDDLIKTVDWSDYPGVRLDTSRGGGDGLNFANPDRGIVFAPDGLPRNDSNNLASGAVFLIGPGSNRRNTITITPAGSIQINHSG